LDSLVPSGDEEAVDLLRRLLHFNPDKRVTADEGLRHRFVVSYVLVFTSNHSTLFFFFFCSCHNPNEEIVKGYDVVPQLSDDIQLTVDEYRKKLYEVNS